MSKAFGLIEVLIAVAIIAGLGLVVSQFVVTQNKQQIDVRSASSCQSRLSSFIAKLKESDNNSKIASWMPQASEMLPTDPYVRARLQRDIVKNYDGTPVGQVIALAGTISHTTYSQSEITSARVVNNYQLISSASSIIASIYPAACNTPIEATSLVDGQLKDMIVSELGGLGGVTLQVQKVGGAVCDPNWQPVPINVNANANTNNADLFKLIVRAEYEEEGTGRVSSCTANATFSPGSDLIPPTLQVSITSGLPSVGPVGNQVFCGDGSTTTTAFDVAIGAGATAEAGVQYLCRLDYVRGNITTEPNRASGTGWFVCSMPTAAIAGVQTQTSPSSNHLAVVGNVTVNSLAGPTQPAVRFRVGNATEGSYRLHVKAIDTARNESSYVENIRIDLTRPTLNIPSVNIPGFTSVTGFPANQYRFQCNNNHNPWVTAPATGYTENVNISNVSFRQGYWNSAAIGNPTFGCSTATAATLPATLADGPKSARFAVCDECNAALAASAPGGPDIDDYIWFVDTQANLSPGPVSFSSGNLHYDAGNNNGNPYVLSHRVIQTIGHPTSTLNPVTTYHVRNNYDLTIPAHTLLNGQVNFPAQGQIAACTTYGHYRYTAQEGCNQPISTRGPEAYTGPGGGGTNPLYCPSFEVSAGSAATPNACAPKVSCSIATSGGYSGDRSSQPDCTYDTTRHAACATPTCSSGYTLITSAPPAPYTAYHYKCSTCRNGNEIVREPVELGGATIATINGGCGTVCTDSPPCLNYARCYTVRKCRTGDPAQDNVREISASGSSGGTTACGMSYTSLACPLPAPATEFENPRYLYLNNEPLVAPESLFGILSPDNRPLCMCSDSNATNYPACDQCLSGYVYDNGSCVAAPCSNGASNPPTCTEIAPVCAHGSTISNINEVLGLQCTTGTLASPPGVQMNATTGVLNWTCENSPALPVSCNTTLTCPIGYDRVGHQCVVHCTSDTQCTPYTCNTATNRCQDSGGNPTPTPTPTPTPPGGGGPGGGGCFIAGTPVNLADGTTKNIEDVIVGDQVISYDEELRETRIDTVITPLHHKKRMQRLFTFILENDVEFTANAIHPIYVVENDNYVSSEEIYMRHVAGDVIHFQDIYGRALKIKNISVEDKMVPVYNLDIAGKTFYHWKYEEGIGHNYYVNGILVHNKIMIDEIEMN